jgi:hypothetical protein
MAFIRTVLPAQHREVLDDRPERQRREEGQAADDQDDADQEADEQRAVGREGARPTGAASWPPSEPAIASAGTIIEEAADQHRDAERRVPEGRVGGEPPKAEPLLPPPRCRRRGSR